MSKDEIDRMAKAKLFHKNGPEREKARSPSVVHLLLARIEGLDHRNEEIAFILQFSKYKIILLFHCQFSAETVQEFFYQTIKRNFALC